MKTAVYTIAKNEEKNVDRFLSSLKDVDCVVVLDTGSTDGTLKKLIDGGAMVEKHEFTPFDFAKARQMALDLVPNDVDMCISMDLDETLEPGWKQELERLYNDGVELIDYLYIETKDNASSFRSKIHTRHGFKWERSIHENIVPDNNREIKRESTDKILVTHHRKKPTNYVKQLNQYIKENPDDADSYIQRGADYITLGKYEEAIKDYRKYLSITEDHNHELIRSRRSYSYIAMAQAYQKLKASSEVIIGCLLKACAENQTSRDPWVYLADAYKVNGNIEMMYGAAMTALRITKRDIGATSDIIWSDYPKQLANTSLQQIINRYK
jgi:glycosyltransferase involved in cell wall biosynthesis